MSTGASKDPDNKIEQTDYTSRAEVTEIVGATAAKRILEQKEEPAKMREFKADKYKRLVEQSENPLLQKFQPAEQKFITHIPDSL